MTLTKVGQYALAYVADEGLLPHGEKRVAAAQWNELVFQRNSKIKKQRLL